MIGGAALVGAASAVTRVWLPATIAAGVAAAVATVAGVWATRGTKILTEHDEHLRRLPLVIRVGKHGHLPRVKDLRDPVAVGVHPAAAIDVDDIRTRTPAFIARDITQELGEAILRDRFVLLVGDSTAGKSRALYEVMRSLLPDRRVVEPLSREGVPAAVDAAVATPGCVLWLDDLERFLGTAGLTTAGVSNILNARGRERFILATMRSEECVKYSGRAWPGSDDLGREALRRSSEVLRLATRLHLPRSWSADELARAAHHRDDPRIGEALRHADRFGVAEYLAAGPQLLADWQDAWSAGAHPRAAALVRAAVDARRAGIHRPLPLSLLEQLHGHYLAEQGGERLHPESWDAAVEWATTPLHATSSLLVPGGGNTYLAFDYLIETVGRTPMPSQALCDLIACAKPEEVEDLAQSAWGWNNLTAVEAAYSRVESNGSVDGTISRSHLIRERDGNIAALRFAQRALTSHIGEFGAEHSGTLELRALVASEHGFGGDTKSALTLMNELLPDVRRILGNENRVTLTIRDAIAGFIQEEGGLAVAARLYEELVTDSARTLGANHQATYWIRFRAAVALSKAGNAPQAMRLLETLRDEVASSGNDCGALPAIRSQLARLRREAGHDAEAVQMYESLAADELAARGRYDLITLDVREELAECVGILGDPARAVRILREAMADALRLEQPPSDVVRSVGRRFADWTGKAGDPQGAVQHLELLVEVAAEQRGDDDHQTLDLRRRLAHWTGKAGSPDKAIHQLERMIVDAENALVPHPKLLQAGHSELTYWQSRVKHQKP